MSICRGCTGTCCTGIGQEPCTCPDPPAEAIDLVVHHIAECTSADAVLVAGGSGDEITGNKVRS